MSDILKTLRMPSGTAFAMLPSQTGGPAPTLLLLALSGLDTVNTEPYCRVGRLLYAQGWNVVSLDLPCHGADRRPSEPPELAGWAARVKAGEDIVAAFQKRVNDIVEHLIATGVADPSASPPPAPRAAVSWRFRRPPPTRASGRRPHSAR